MRENINFEDYTQNNEYTVQNVVTNDEYTYESQQHDDMLYRDVNEDESQSIQMRIQSIKQNRRSREII